MKTCSKTSFKKWINDVRRAYRRMPEIKDKIAYYESQLDGYHAVAYDSVRVKTFGNAQERKLLFTIQKIQDEQKKLKALESITETHKLFAGSLDDDSKNILDYIVLTNLKPLEVCLRMNIKRARYYHCLDVTMKKWRLYNNMKNAL